MYSDYEEVLNNGVSKDAVTDLRTRRVHINILRWSNSSELEKQVTTTMEMTLLLDIPNRYTLGQRLTKELAAKQNTSTPSDIQRFFKWAAEFIVAQNQNQDLPLREVDIAGKTQDGTPCRLFVSDQTYSANSPTYYLSLGLGNEASLQDKKLKALYIGGHVSGDRPDVQVLPHEIHYRTVNYETVGYLENSASSANPNGSPIAVFSDRRLKIEFTDYGSIFRVTGTTSRVGERPVVCNFEP